MNPVQNTKNFPHSRFRTSIGTNQEGNKNWYRQGSTSKTVPQTRSTTRNLNQEPWVATPTKKPGRKERAAARTAVLPPPRLQYDLHKEATQQLGELEENEISYEETHDGEGMSGIGTNGFRERGWRRRRQRWIERNKTERHNTVTSRSSSLFRRQNQQQAQSPEIFDELREVQLLAWERRIRASVCLLLFPVKKEDVDIVENYFDEGYQKETDQDFSEEIGEEKVEDSKYVTSTVRHRIDEHYATASSNGQATIGGFDDLIFEEENPSTSEATMKALSSPQSVSPQKSPAK